MGSPDKKLLGIVNFWGSWKRDTANVSRDFWMPDQSCRVCYDCDSQFTVFNRRHHCRVCGRVFCAKCTAHSIPNYPDKSKSDREESERIRVCNYCFRQWEQGLVTSNHETGGASSPRHSLSPSETSLVSINSSFTVDSSASTVGSMAYSTGPYEHVTYGPSVNSEESFQSVRHSQSNGMTDPISLNSYVDIGDESSNTNQYDYCVNRSDGEDNANGGYYGAVNFDESDHMYRSCKGDFNGEEDRKGVGPLTSVDFGSEFLEGINSVNEPGTKSILDEPETSLYGIDSADVENLDFENNGLLWIPPEPEDEDADREAELFDDDDDGDATEEWGYQSFYGSMAGGEHREKTNEEHRRAMKNVVGGHFKALITQLLQVDNIVVGEDYDNENWLDIITSLSWEAASLLKPDMSKGSGMDPGGYVKVKCLASGKRSDSIVVKGVVCKKNVAHRRMTAKFDRPRLLILGGALEYQRVSNHLSSFDTLLQQEMDHLKMAVAKISAHNPNILLVEKSVSRFAQEYLLAKNISLVLNIKRPLLERIARCTGAQIVPSIDHLKSPILGYCESFHVDKYFEEHGSADQGGKKLTKTLMFFEGCPKPLGCTILLKGAPGDELKKIKHVIQYGVFAAYHLALETSYLADEGASLPELPLKSPITVALPDKPFNINRSISTVTDLVTPTTERPQSESNHQVSQMPSLSTADAVPISETSQSSSLTNHMQSYLSPVQSAVDASLCSSLNDVHISVRNDLPQDCISDHISKIGVDHFPERNFVKPDDNVHNDGAVVSFLSGSVPLEHSVSKIDDEGSALTEHDPNNSGNQSCSNFGEQNEKVQPLKEDFPSSPCDGQSILVSLTTRCVWKGVVCERAHLFRIKYYRNFDKPLGRFLLDDLFDQNYRCRVCEMPSEAHIHCYTHQQGSLTISVRRLTEFPLPGERDGKIWMWHRCLRCPRVNGFPPATKRVAMSDAAWGLSFGKFLELSFSNHVAASRVSSCGHSLHKDCLRFYGCGPMVACFRYAPIIVHSVYLPPSKLEFPCDNLEWVQKEAEEVRDRTELLYAEVFNAINEISDKWLRSGLLENNPKASELKKHIMGLEKILEKEKEDFEESMQKTLQTDKQAATDILEINRLRRRLLMESYLWDHRLIYTSNLDAKISQCDSLMLKSMEETLHDVEKMDKSAGNESVKESGSCDSVISDEKTGDLSQGLNIKPLKQLNSYSEERNIGHDKMPLEGGEVLSNGVNMDEAGQGNSVNTVQLVASAGESPKMVNLSDTLEAAWIGENYLGNVKPKENDAINSEKHIDARDEGEIHRASSVALPVKSSDFVDNSTYWLMTPFLNIYQSLGKNMSWNDQKLDAVGDYNPVFVSSIREMERQGGARLLLPVGVDDIIIPVYDDEPTSIIAHALASREYKSQTSDDPEMKRDGIESAVSLPHINSANSFSLPSPLDASFGTMRSFGSSEESFLSMSGSRNSLTLDPLFYTKALHAKVSFSANDPLGNVKYTVTCYYAKRFEALRKICCPSELDYIRSLSRCKKWGAQGGKSNVFFAKTLDDRFIIKQVTKTELESFIKFAPAYFKYLSESISSFSPTCLAKILGIYQVTSKHLKGGRESKMDVLVMENLLFRRNIVRLYDLKGSCRSRYNPDSSGGNKVLLDQNLIETMPTSPIFVGNKAKRLLERAIWNDTSFLASIDVMDYSLLVGIDEERRELVVGIIDFMRQYTWDKHLETWVKASGILGGSKNAQPTVISPDQYKKRFRKAMTTYFLMVPDQWSPPTIIPSEPLSDSNEESSKL